MKKTQDFFDEPIPAPPRLLRRAMNLSIVSAIFWTFYFSATNSSLLTGAMLSLKFNEEQVARVMSLSLVFLPLQIVGALLQQRFFHRKKFWAVCCASAYAMFFVLSLLMFMWARLDPVLGTFLFMGTFAVAQIFVQIQAATGLSWNADIVPPRESATYWARKTGMATLAGLVAGLAFGKIADILGREKPHTYAILFAAGAILAYMSFFVYLPAVDPDPRPKGLPPLRQLFVDTWKNRNFRMLTAFFGWQAMGAWLSCSFLFIHLQKTMEFSMFTIQILLAIGAAVGFLSAYLFRIVGSRYGRKPVLILCSVLKGGEFLLWASMIPRDSWLDRTGGALINRALTFFQMEPVALDAGLLSAIPVFVVGGFVNVGIASSQTSILTSVGSKKTQGVTYGIFFAVVGLCGFLTANLSGRWYGTLAEQPWIEAPLTPFNLLSALSALFYLLSVLWLIHLREDGAASTGVVVRDILSSNPFRSVYHAHVLTQPLSELGRVEALTRASGRLVSNELIRNIYSASSRVRDGALQSIVRQEESLAPEVVAEVVKLLDLPELGMQTAAARALGRIGEASAVPALLRHFEDEDFSVAQASIFAAGLIGDARCEDMLMRIIDNPKKSRLHSGAAEALSKIGGPRHIRRVFGVYESQTHWVLRRECLISSVRLLLPEKKAAYAMFESEELRPGSQLEKRLRRVVNHESWEGTMRPPPFEEIIEEFDAGRLEKCSAWILAPLLERCRVFPDRQKTLPVSLLNECFMPAGRMRYGALNSEDPEGSSLWFQVKLWAEIKYNFETPDSTLFFAQLLAAEALLDGMSSAVILDEILGRNTKNT